MSPNSVHWSIGVRTTYLFIFLFIIMQHKYIYMLLLSFHASSYPLKRQMTKTKKNESEINHWSGSGRRWKGATMLLYKKWKLRVKISCHNTPSSISYLDASNGQYTPFGLTSTGPSTGEKYTKHCCTTTNQLYTVTCLCLPSYSDFLTSNTLLMLGKTW